MLAIHIIIICFLGLTIGFLLRLFLGSKTSKAIKIISVAVCGLNFIFCFTNFYELKYLSFSMFFLMTQLVGSSVCNKIFKQTTNNVVTDTDPTGSG
jgi:hypothetical protein